MLKMCKWFNVKLVYNVSSHCAGETNQIDCMQQTMHKIRMKWAASILIIFVINDFDLRINQVNLGDWMRGWESEIDCTHAKVRTTSEMIERNLWIERKTYSTLRKVCQSYSRRQAIFWTNAGILLIALLKTNFDKISIEIHTFSFKKIHLNMSSGSWRIFCLGLNMLDVSHKCSNLGKALLCSEKTSSSLFQNDHATFWT